MHGRLPPHRVCTESILHFDAPTGRSYEILNSSRVCSIIWQCVPLHICPGKQVHSYSPIVRTLRATHSEFSAQFLIYTISPRYPRHNGLCHHHCPIITKGRLSATIARRRAYSASPAVVSRSGQNFGITTLDATSDPQLSTNWAGAVLTADSSVLDTTFIVAYSGYPSY